MAGEMLLGVAAEAVLSRLVSVVTGEINLAWGFEAELKTLSTKSTMILALLHDAGRCQVKGKSFQVWLKNLKNAAYDADDVLEEFSFEMLRRKLENTNRMKNKASNFFSVSNPISFRFKMSHKVKNIIMMLDQVVEQGTKLGLHQLVYQAGESTSKNFNNRGRKPFIDDSKVFGREVDKSKVTNMLLNFKSEEQLPFVAIVGLGGLGKTTLAQLVYKEESVTRYFDKKIWVCVSDDFSVTRILKEMAESLMLNIGGGEISNIEAMILRLAEKLKGTKYLLVLDDVWNTSAEKWDLLANSLLGINASKGSRVLVTTRSDEVVSTMQTVQSYHLGKLTEEESWSIFQQRAFASGREKETPYLVDVGKKLVRRCGGLPLALNALGGLMHSKEEHEWISMEESNIWELSYEKTGIMPVLRLSFDQLPLWSKQCFAYCSLFPQDFQFNKDNLIQLWIAQGFIQASQPQERKLVMEDIGNDYFNSLLLISFFQDVEMDIYGNITHCKMHDLVHDLAVLVSKSECLALDANKVKIDDIEVRHLSTGENEDIIQTIPEVNARRLRTLFMASYAHDNFLKKFKYLRVLTLERSKIKELPAKIGKLKHLRYLDVSDTEITTFPASLTKLYNLQTLRLMDCRNFKEFPEELANLVNLRHLYFNYGKMPRKIGQLINLQTLLCFTVAKDNGHEIEELRSLSKLQSEVILCNLELVRDKEEARRAMLWEKINLYMLSLVWSEEREGAENDEDVLEGLQPPPNLKGLTIQGFSGGKFPSWMTTLDTMNNNGLPQRLVKIELTNCKKCEDIPTLGELPFLRFLEISGMHNVKRIGTEFYSKNEAGACTSSVVSSSQNKGRTLFPALEKLSLHNMDNLVEWTEAANDATCPPSVVVFPRLQTLHIEKCSKLTTIPSHFPSLTDLSIVDVNNLTRLSIDRCEKLNSIPPDGQQMVTSSLEYLKITDCRKLISIPSLQSLTTLQELEISGCDGVTNLPNWLGTCISLEKLTVIFCPNLISVSIEELRELKSLSHLRIYHCGKLKSLSLEEFLHYLTHLESLEIGGFSKELESFPFKFSNPYYIHQHLQRLQLLTLVGWPKLKSLPDQIRHLPALRDLSIEQFDGVEALPEWLGDLSSLQSLSIWFCKNLEYLPSAESIRRLTNLRWLEIYNCSHLTERCNRGNGGTEWSKISHIPYIQIDRAVIQDLYQEKETGQDKEMRQPKDAETLIAPSPVHWSIPIHEVENKYDIETKKGKMKQQWQGTEARTISIAGIGSSMTPALSGESEAESKIFQERGPPSSIKSAANPEIITEILYPGEAERSIQHTVHYILGCINAVNTRKIGIYGNGGIGKTTVLKALINYQELKDLFELIIWVTVSKYWSIRKIQNEIVRQLDIDFADSESDSEIAEKLFHVLRSKRFLLLLDDVWDWIDLEAVGIPDPSNGVDCRIIMATRLRGVCRKMGTYQEVKVEGLSRDEAWELFHKQLGKIIDSPDIQSFARAIVEGCGGLPLTIIVTGRALRDENDVRLWRNASTEFFQPNTSGLHDTQTAIHQLKFGYDRLRSREQRSFFLYCALFPENHEIHISALIDYFIKEGLIAGDLRDAHKKGHDIVEVLVNAALLERIEGGLFVKMHDMIRDLAKVVLSTDPEAGQLLVGVDLKLTRPSIPDEEQNLGGKILIFERHNFLLRAGVGLTEPPPKQEWENPQLICLMDNKLTSLPDTLSCPNLSTLFLQRNYQLRVIPPSFFDSMPSLQYLNLSETRIKSLPSSLSKLTSLQALILRDCNRFAMLPSEVGLLGKLKILDLQGTEVDKLPNEIGKLVCLKHLEVSFYGSTSRSENVMLPPELIPRGMISNLPELEKLNVVVHPEDQRWRRSVEYVILEVGSLTKLTVLSFYFPEIELLKLFLEMSPSWKGKGLTNFNFVVGHNVERIVARVPEDVDLDFGRRGKCLRFINSDMIPDAVVDVLTRTTAFYLDHHFAIGSLSEFGLGNIERLEFCVVRECPKMHTIIDKTDVANAALPFLERLSIHYLWSLMRIWETMTMPSGSFARLRILSVHTCPKLSFVFHCSMLQCFTKLEELVVEDCPAMKEIIIWDDVVNPGISILPSLKKLTLHYLPGLVNIWKGHWPLLEQISFYNCSNLKNLGMDSNLEHTLKEIKAEKDWWDALAWEETALFLHLQDRFYQITDDDL